MKKQPGLLGKQKNIQKKLLTYKLFFNSLIILKFQNFSSFA